MKLAKVGQPRPEDLGPHDSSIDGDVQHPTGSLGTDCTTKNVASKKRLSSLPSYARPTRCSQSRAGSFLPQPVSSPYSSCATQTAIKPSASRISSVTGSLSYRQSDTSGSKSHQQPAVSNKVSSASLKHSDGSAAQDQQKQQCQDNPVVDRNQSARSRQSSASSSSKHALPCAPDHSRSNAGAHGPAATSRAATPRVAAVTPRSTASRTTSAVPSILASAAVADTSRSGAGTSRKQQTQPPTPTGQERYTSRKSTPAGHPISGGLKEETAVQPDRCKTTTAAPSAPAAKTTRRRPVSSGSGGASVKPRASASPAQQGSIFKSSAARTGAAMAHAGAASAAGKPIVVARKKSPIRASASPTSYRARAAARAAPQTAKSAAEATTSGGSKAAAAAAAQAEAVQGSTSRASGQFTMLVTPGGPNWPANARSGGLVPYSITPPVKTAARTVATPRQQRQGQDQQTDTASAANAANAVVAHTAAGANRRSSGSIAAAGSAVNKRAATERTAAAATVSPRRTRSFTKAATAGAAAAAAVATADRPASSRRTGAAIAASGAAKQSVPSSLRTSASSAASSRRQSVRASYDSNAVIRSLPGTATGVHGGVAAAGKAQQPISAQTRATATTEAQLADTTALDSSTLHAHLTAAAAAAATEAAAAHELESQIIAEAAAVAAAAQAAAEQEQLAAEAAAAAAALAAAAAAEGTTPSSTAAQTVVAPIPACTTAAVRSSNASFSMPKLRSPELSPVRCRTPRASPTSAAQHAQLVAQLQDLTITWDSYKSTRDASPSPRQASRSSVHSRLNTAEHSPCSGNSPRAMQGDNSSVSCELGELGGVSPMVLRTRPNILADSPSTCVNNTDLSPLVSQSVSAFSMSSLGTPRSSSSTREGRAPASRIPKLGLQKLTAQPQQGPDGTAVTTSRGDGGRLSARDKAIMAAQLQKLETSWVQYKSNRDSSPLTQRSARGRSSIVRASVPALSSTADTPAASVRASLTVSPAKQAAAAAEMAVQLQELQASWGQYKSSRDSSPLPRSARGRSSSRAAAVAASTDSSQLPQAGTPVVVGVKNSSSSNNSGSSSSAGKATGLKRRMPDSATSAAAANTTAAYASSRLAAAATTTTTRQPSSSSRSARKSMVGVSTPPVVPVTTASKTRYSSRRTSTAASTSHGNASSSKQHSNTAPEAAAAATAAAFTGTDSVCPLSPELAGVAFSAMTPTKAWNTAAQWCAPSPNASPYLSPNLTPRAADDDAAGQVVTAEQPETTGSCTAAVAAASAAAQWCAPSPDMSPVTTPHASPRVTAAEDNNTKTASPAGVPLQQQDAVLSAAVEGTATAAADGGAQSPEIEAVFSASTPSKIPRSPASAAPAAALTSPSNSTRIPAAPGYNSPAAGSPGSTLLSSPAAAAATAACGSPGSFMPGSPLIPDGAGISEVAERLATWSIQNYSYSHGSSFSTEEPADTAAAAKKGRTHHNSSPGSVRGPAAAQRVGTGRKDSKTSSRIARSGMKNARGSSAGKTRSAISRTSAAAESPTLCWMVSSSSPGTVECKATAAAAVVHSVVQARPEDVQLELHSEQLALDPLQASWLAFTAAADTGSELEALTPPRFRLSGVGLPGKQSTIGAAAAAPPGSSGSSILASSNTPTARRIRQVPTAALRLDSSSEIQATMGDAGLQAAEAEPASPASSDADVFYTPMQCTPSSALKTSSSNRSTPAGGAESQARDRHLEAVTAARPDSSTATMQSKRTHEQFFTPIEGLSAALAEAVAAVAAAAADTSSNDTTAEQQQQQRDDADIVANNSSTIPAAAEAAAQMTQLAAESAVATDAAIAATAAAASVNAVSTPAAAVTTEAAVSKKLWGLFEAAGSAQQTKQHKLQQQKQQTPMSFVHQTKCEIEPVQEAEQAAAGHAAAAAIGSSSLDCRPSATPMPQQVLAAPMTTPVATAAAAASPAAFLTAISPVLRSVSGFGPLSARKLPHIGSGARRVKVAPEDSPVATFAAAAAEAGASPATAASVNQSKRNAAGAVIAKDDAFAPAAAADGSVMKRRSSGGGFKKAGSALLSAFKVNTAKKPPKSKAHAAAAAPAGSGAVSSSNSRVLGPAKGDDMGCGAYAGHDQADLEDSLSAAAAAAAVAGDVQDSTKAFGVTDTVAGTTGVASVASGIGRFAITAEKGDSAPAEVERVGRVLGCEVAEGADDADSSGFDDGVGCEDSFEDTEMWRGAEFETFAMPELDTSYVTTRRRR